MGKTLIQIEDKIKTIAQNHRQIKFYGDEKIWNVTTSGTVNYPVFFAVYQGTELRRGEQGHKFMFYSLDIIRKDRANLNDIFNDTNRTMADVIAELEWGGDMDIDLKVESFNMDSIDEGFMDDEVAGHSCQVTVWTDFTINSCVIPTIT